MWKGDFLFAVPSVSVRWNGMTAGERSKSPSGRFPGKRVEMENISNLKGTIVHDNLSMSALHRGEQDSPLAHHGLFWAAVNHS